MKPMVILTGPTAVGKTELSIRLAKILDAEIISADSMQVYKKMDIGTAKIMPEEMEGIKHYLVDELDPKEEFHVARFQQMAKDALKEIYAKGKIPLIVGGTGFYIQSLLYDIDFTKEDEDLLAGCYTECLKLAADTGVESIAFCCLSTGVFHFPQQRAAEIATNTVKQYLNKDSRIKKVIFNVFKDEDLKIYSGLL